jgi:Mlc titration factor MtfA (ptsG expression regulator)
VPTTLEGTAPALYEVLAAFYRQDPAARIRAVLANVPDRAGSDGQNP